MHRSQRGSTLSEGFEHSRSDRHIDAHKSNGHGANHLKASYITPIDIGVTHASTYLVKAIQGLAVYLTVAAL